jgi:DNA-binding MarR family transcriptional regulator
VAEQALPREDHVLTGEAIRRLLYRRDLALTRHRAGLARRLGVTDVEMVALGHLAEQGELSPSAIGVLLDLSSGGATALVQRLERSGHVTRHPHPTDRRSTLIALSPETARRLDEANAPLNEGIEAMAASLSEPEQTAVEGTLTQLATLSEELEASLRAESEPAAEAMARPVPSLWA